MTGKGLIIAFFLIGFGCSNRASTSQNNSVDKKVIGCSNFVVYWLSEDSKSYYHIYLDARKYNLEAENNFDIGNGDISVTYKHFESDISRTLCTDIRPIESLEAISTKRATDGVIKVSLTQENLKLHKEGTAYEIQIELIDVKFVDESRISTNLGKVNVGWFPG